ncbi:RidA family protein [Devosia sediminis]|uniref:RidA family protein n=1 Tax=Devosia sediminis TaxID=2798801 RepID=A0A934IRD6_9HYPH|nr:RidA family protein [Devosia sediminis]MBJ3783786.1 RidA family protein [Devosia sediminis]
MTVKHLNPPGLHNNPVFSQGIVLPANARIVLIGGQNSVNDKGEVVHKGDMARQTAQALANMVQVLEAAGAGVEHLVKTTIIMRDDADLQAGFGEWMKVWGGRANPPLVTAMRVTALANPDFLIEIEAMAVLP